MSAWMIFASGANVEQHAGHPVVEPGTEAHDQVGLLQRGDRGDRPVHPRHAEVLRMAVGEGAARHQRRDDGCAGDLGEPCAARPTPRADDTAADIEHGPAGLAEQAGRLAHLLGVRLGDGAVAGRFISTGQLNVVRACSASFAMSTSTGPGRPVPARWKASAIVRGMSAGSVIR
jgi:hypothetical protein